MTPLPSVLGTGDLPLPELAAARLDGDLYDLGEGYCPVDRGPDPWLRAHAVLVARSERLIAELGTAAWIWGATVRYPHPIECCVEPSARAGRIPEPGITIRELLFEPQDLVAFGRHTVTAPLRTAVDLARFRAEFGADEAETVRELAAIGGFGLDDAVALMNRRRNLHGKRRAAIRLASAL